MAAFMVGGGYLGSVNSAPAGGDPGKHQIPGRDGLSVACHMYSMSPRDYALICNVMGTGEDGAASGGGQ